jgi:hypothetical protein
MAIVVPEAVGKSRSWYGKTAGLGETLELAFPNVSEVNLLQGEASEAAPYVDGCSVWRTQNELIVFRARSKHRRFAEE